MANSDLIVSGQSYFPGLNIQFKNSSTLMKVLGKVLFFNPSFMTGYITTIGKTIYVPTPEYIPDSLNGFTDVFIHECTHLYDKKRLSILYTLGYIFPQVLSPLVLFLLFVLSWKIVVPMAIFFLLPLPAPFRSYFERRAYYVQMYAGKQIFNIDPSLYISEDTSHFTASDYYFMWPFEGSGNFTQEAANVIANKPSCEMEPALFSQVNAMIFAAKK